jgi:hypothetical protein
MLDAGCWIQTSSIQHLASSIGVSVTIAQRKRFHECALAFNE